MYGLYLTGGTTLDYDTTASYVLSVQCSDHRRSDTETYTVNLIRNTVSTGMSHIFPACSLVCYGPTFKYVAAYYYAQSSWFYAHQPLGDRFFTSTFGWQLVFVLMHICVAACFMRINIWVADFSHTHFGGSLLWNHAYLGGSLFLCA